MWLPGVAVFRRLSERTETSEWEQLRRGVRGPGAPAQRRASTSTASSSRRAASGRGRAAPCLGSASAWDARVDVRQCAPTDSVSTTATVPAAYDVDGTVAESITALSTPVTIRCVTREVFARSVDLAQCASLSTTPTLSLDAPATAPPEDLPATGGSSRRPCPPGSRRSCRRRGGGGARRTWRRTPCRAASSTRAHGLQTAASAAVSVAVAARSERRRRRRPERRRCLRARAILSDTVLILISPSAPGSWVSCS